MWTEPLTAVIRELDEHMYGVAVIAGDRTVCAHVRVAYSLEAARQALAFVADRIRMTQSAGASITEPLATASTNYTFGSDHPA